MTWPDWTGETALIIGTGPSLASEPLELARGHVKAIAIKSAWKRAPWADVLYGMDKGWWLANQGAPDFSGLKVTASPTAARVYRLMQVRLRPFASILLKTPGVIGCGVDGGGGHSGFQAMNLAAQFGARQILLTGFDMTLANGAHWTTDYHGVGKPDVKRTEGWRKAMDRCAEQFTDLDIEVINCTMGSALTAYRKLPLTEALWQSESRPRSSLSIET